MYYDVKHICVIIYCLVKDNIHQFYWMKKQLILNKYNCVFQIFKNIYSE